MNETATASQSNGFSAIEKGVTLVDFNAPWCGPCRAMEPVLDGVEKAYSGKAAVLKVNVDENRDIAMELGIQSIPTLIVFKEGREVYRFVGIQAESTLTAALDSALD
jgi:thioredoxin 1